MTEATITVAVEPEAPEAAEILAPVEPATNEHDVAVSETEAAAEIAVAEIEAETAEAVAETIADALETEAVKTIEEENEWLKERIASLEARLVPPPIPTETDPTLNPSIPLPSQEEVTDPETVAELEAETETTETMPPLSDASLTDDQESVVVIVAEVEPAKPRKRRMLI